MKNNHVLAIAAAAYLVLAFPATAQKTPTDEVGFNAQKLYDVNDIDSVNLFNGNLTVTLPIGRRYQVSSALSYQFMLVYNGKIYDIETEDCEDPFGNPMICETWYPTRQSNAGVAWRVSLGRLLAPYDPSPNRSSFDRDDFIYESPAGDEHSFPAADPDDATVILSDDPQPLRLVRITSASVPTRDLEFPNGEVHRFQEEQGAWRLKHMRDRFGAQVTISYTYVQIDGKQRDSAWTITDTVGRSHTVSFVHHASLRHTWSLGQSVSSMVLDGFQGADTTYTFTYPTSGWLGGVNLPDGTSYTFSYDLSSFLETITLPTRGSISYAYQSYAFANEDVCTNGPTGTDNNRTLGIKSRTISDGVTTRVWEYVQRRGPEVPVNYDNPPCSNTDGSYADEHGPFYWVRTSVLAPVDTEGTRVRSDHYFNIFYEPPYPDIDDHPFVEVPRPSFGYPGVAGRPNDATAKGPLTYIADDVLNYPADVSGSDGTNERSLASRIYGGCDAAGDCTNGSLLRSTYVRYACDDQGLIYNSTKCWAVSSRTVMDDDLGCGDACYTQETMTGRTGAGFHTTTTAASNFPPPGTTCSSAAACAEAVTATTYTAYAPWPSTDRLNASKAWITGTYTEQQRTEGTAAAKSEYQFSATTGVLEAVRTLKETARGPEDLLTIFVRDNNGNVTQEKSFGGDEAGLATDACCAVPTTGLDYLSRKTYDASNFLTKTEYLASCTDISQAGCTSILTTLDRTVDKWTGLTTSTRDPAGVETKFDYDAIGRLETVGPTVVASGSSRSYDYFAATSSSNARVTEAVSSGSGTPLGTSTFEFDGLGRVRRTSTPLPDGKLASVQTDYDAHGRAMRVSQPVERTTHPTISIGSYWTTSIYDALGRQVSVTAPDGAVTNLDYVGSRSTSRTHKVATSPSASSSEWTDAATIEYYDALGRLRRVDESAGGTTSVANPTGTITSMDYTYDVGGRLISVKDGTSTQERVFVYDGRGFLTSETHPENGATTYTKYDARGHALQRTSGGKTLKFVYDEAERLTSVADITGTEKLLKSFAFATANDGSNLQAGKLQSATRYNYLPSAGNVEVKETYVYDTPTGQMSSRTTLVERVAGARNAMQQFSYSLIYDEFLLPKTVAWPTCSLNGCGTSNGLGSVTFGRSAGYLTSVAGFAGLTYHPSGMVKTVVHESSPAATDTYSAVSGLARPSAITFSGGSPGCAAPTSSPITAVATVCPGSTGNSASVTPRTGVTHTWAIAGGTITSTTTGDAVTFTAGSSGVITLTVTATDACNETAVSSKSIEITGQPIAPVISAPAAVCGGTGGHTASIDSQPGIAWSITGGTITSSTSSASITFTAGASGSVTLTATVTNACSGSASTSKTVSITPTPTATLSAPATVIAGGTIQINVSLTGSAPWRLEWSDGYVQSNVSTANVSRSVAPDETRTYDVGVTSGDCVGTSNGPILVTVLPPPPSSVAATTQQNRDVLVTWSPVGGASGYRIERTTRTGASSTFVTTVSAAVTAFNDVVPATTTPVTYIYYVRTVDTAGELSDRGPWDHATAATTLYLQPQITTGTTIVRGSDMTELRAAIDALRYAVSFAPAFSASTPPAGLLITAADFTALTSALSQARAAIGAGAFTYVGVSAPAPGGTVMGAHITQLREALR